MKKAYIDVLSRNLAVWVLVVYLLAVFKWFSGATVPFLAFAVGGGALIQVVFEARAKELLASLGSGALLALGYARLHGGFSQDAISEVAAVAAFLGFGSIVVMGFKASVSTECLRPFLLAIFCPTLAVVANVALAALIQFQPMVFDHHLLAFDGTLGFQASAIAGAQLVSHPALKLLCELVYEGLPVPLVLVLALHIKKAQDGPNPFYTFPLAAVLGCVFYQMMPAAGPVHLFPFPNLPQTASLQAVALPFVPRNAIPSLHTAWAVLIYLALRTRSDLLRWFGAAFLGLTLLATLGFGEHYLIDLIVAVPFTLAVLALCLQKWWFGGAFLVVVSAWMVLLRFCQPVTSAQAWISIAATGLICLPGFLVCCKNEEPSREKVLGLVGNQEVPASTV